MERLRSFVTRLRPGPVAVLIGAIAVAALLVVSRPDRPAIEIPEKAWSVDVIPAVPSAIRPTLELYARIESPEDARLSAAVEADVLEVLVQDGDTVAAGDPLVIVDDRDARFELLQRDADVQEIRAQINLEQQRLRRNKEALFKEQELLDLTVANAERARSLYKDNLVSLSNVDDSAEELKRQELAVTSRQLVIEESEIRKQQLTAQLQRAEALRDKAQLALDRTRITAPFAGVISEVDASVGDRVRIGDELMRLHNPDALELRTQVPTRFAGRVRDALEAGVAIEATESAAIAVPAEAVYGRNRIYVVRGERMAGLDVQRLGERVRPDGRSEVLIRSEGLDPGDRIITTKISSATNGLLVRVREGAAANGDAMLAAGENRTPR
jgi:multidrug efflux pump subunit AcrA (membrane-fusion protein)